MSPLVSKPSPSRIGEREKRRRQHVPHASINLIEYLRCSLSFMPAHATDLSSHTASRWIRGVVPTIRARSEAAQHLRPKSLQRRRSYQDSLGARGETSGSRCALSHAYEPGHDAFLTNSTHDRFRGHLFCARCRCAVGTATASRSGGRGACADALTRSNKVHGQWDCWKLVSSIDLGRTRNDRGFGGEWRDGDLAACQIVAQAAVYLTLLCPVT